VINWPRPLAIVHSMPSRAANFFLKAHDLWGGPGFLERAPVIQKMNPPERKGDVFTRPGLSCCRRVQLCYLSSPKAQAWAQGDWIDMW